MIIMKVLDCQLKSASPLSRDENQSRMQTFVAVRWLRQGRCHSGGFLLRIMPPSWHPVPVCTPRLRCRRANLICGDDKPCSDSQVWA